MSSIDEAIKMVRQNMVPISTSPSVKDGLWPHLEAMFKVLEGKWVIWSNEHDAWWRPDHSGYTVHFKSAGLYTYEEAVKICAGANYGCSGDGEYDTGKRARNGGGRPMETMLPAVGCYGRKNNIRHPEAA